MPWVWERFQNSFCISHDDSRNPINQRQVSSQIGRCKLRACEWQADTSPTADEGESDEAEDSLTNTCDACQVTVHRSGRRQARVCPFCGTTYPRRRRRSGSLRSRAGFKGEREVGPEAEVDAEQDGAGAGDVEHLHRRRVRSQRSCSDPVVQGLRLPAIEPSSERTAARLARTSVSDFVTSRPGSETSLPPISKDVEAGKFPGLSPSEPSAPAPEADFRAALGVVSSGTLSPTVPANLRIGNVSPSASKVGTPLDLDDRPVPSYPERDKTREEFLQDVEQAEKNTNYLSLQRFYVKTFSSLIELCALFKINPVQDGGKMEDPELKMEFLYSVYDTLNKMPTQIQDAVLSSTKKALRDKDRLLYRKDEVRSLFMLIQNPLFRDQSAYNILAGLLWQIVHLPSVDLQLMVHWFKILEVDRLRYIVAHLMQFLTIRQFSHSDKSLPPLSKTLWWIPAATKTLALINAANNASKPPLLHYTDLYNSALDHTDLMQDYFNWQNPGRSDQFSFCQYPFILSIVAKRIILKKDSEQQMILNARRSLVAMVSRHQPPHIDIFYVNIHVRRSHLVSDSLNEIANKQKDLKKKLKVAFVGEPGVDMGGLTKEWFLLLIRQIFHPDYGMFVYHPHSRSYWFRMPTTGEMPPYGELSPPPDSSNLREYNLIGVLMGLAVYNSTILDLHFPSICYRKLLSPPTVPSADSASLGVVRNPTVDDLAEIMPDVARGLSELLAYEGNVEEDMCMSFQVSLEEYGDVKTFLLKADGADIPVTNENRQEYVQLYLDWVLNTAIYHQFRAFYLGFHSVCSTNALILLRPEEVEMLVCGSPSLDLTQLRIVTEYDGYKADDQIITDFWDVLTNMSDTLKKKFLLFTTGSDRVPVGGMGEMSLKITKVASRTDNLPEAHTCFNQLVLPQYSSKETLKQKLTIAISNAEGFGLE